MATSTTCQHFPFIAAVFLVSFIVIGCPPEVNGQHTGVFLSLNGVTIPNNSHIIFYDIGSDGILCNTDRMDCCRRADHPNGVAQGRWYDPEGNEVGSFTEEDATNHNRNFFARNRLTGAVRLYPFRTPTERGRFWCEIPNASGVNEVLYVIINSFPPLINDIVGVALQLHEVTIPNNSLIDIGDLLYRTVDDPDPINANGLHYRTLVCVTDLEDCCDSPRTVRGNWYYPDGHVVVFDARGSTFLSNRGPNEIINGHHFYGSVRLFHRWSHPPRKGRFRCELPSADNPNVNQILYANIVDFGVNHSTIPVIISSSGSGIAGENYALTCSATLVDPVPLPSNIPTPTFEWFFGPNGNDSLSSCVTSTATTLGSNHTYTSSLQFSPLAQSHAGMYTCRLGVGILANSAIITVNASSDISVQITTSGSSVLGESGFTLTCYVSGADHLNPFITYQWTKQFDGTQTQIQDGPDPRTISFTPLSISDVGCYTCQATISSFDLNINLVRSGSQDVTVTIPAPTSVIVSPTSPGIVRPQFGSAITLTCTVELSPVVNIPVNVTTMWAGPAGFKTTNTAQPVMGTTVNYTSTAVVSSFGRNESGVYTCTATATTTSPFLRDSTSNNGTARITVGVYLSLNKVVYANNSIIQNTKIGETDPYTSQNEGLQCITDKIPCCETEPNNSGEWYFPNGTTVLAQGSAISFYHNEGDDGTVTLNRINSDAISPTGLFCCVIPDATDTLQRVCATIISVQINDSTSTSLIVGQNYTLTCRVHGTDSTVTAYQWMKNGTLLSNEMQATLSFSSIRLSDAGQYTCEVTVKSMKYSTVEEITIAIPSPTSVRVTSVPLSPIRPVGSAVTLTCTVELSPMVDFPVTVTTLWTVPAGLMTTNIAHPVMGNNTRYASTATIGLFGRNQSGIYTCTTTISSASLNPFIRDSITSSSTRVTVGVYLSFKRTVYADKSVIQITEIGETEPYTAQGGVQCLTDRKPCCRNDQFSAGEWLFPNGSSVPTQESAAVFYRNRGDDGSVSLNVLSSDTVLPLLTGVFCCVVPDATNTVQTACVDIKLTFSTEIGGTGATVAGQSYTLHCNVTGIEKFSPILSYKWTKNNGTLTNVGSNSNTLSFSPLRLSDAGQYICHVTASSDVTNERVTNASSQSFEVDISVPEHTVSLHSSSPKLTPILSESSFTLTCTMELNPAVDVPVTVSTVWTGPDGANITSAARPERKSFTLYTSVNTFHSVDSADSGNYTCTASVENGVKVSASTNVNIVDGLFQLRLMSSDICQKWYSENSAESEHHSNFIKEALIEAIEYQCKCHFPSTNLLERDIFVCSEDSPNRMTYRNMLLGTHNFNGKQIVGFIQDWVNTGPLIKIGGNYVRVDSGCPAAISTMYASTCEQEEVCVYDNNPTHAICAQHLTNKNTTVATCIEGCIFRNG